MATQVEMVKSGLSYTDSIRFKGEILEVDEEVVPILPKDQFERWEDVYFVEVGSKFDTDAIKQVLSRGETSLFERNTVNLKPQLTDLGRQVFSEEFPSGNDAFESIIGDDGADDNNYYIPSQNDEDPSLETGEDEGGVEADEGDETVTEDATEEATEKPGRSKKRKGK